MCVRFVLHSGRGSRLFSVETRPQQLRHRLVPQLPPFRCGRGGHPRQRSSLQGRESRLQDSRPKTLLLSPTRSLRPGHSGGRRVDVPSSSEPGRLFQPSEVAPAGGEREPSVAAGDIHQAILAACPAWRVAGDRSDDATRVVTVCREGGLYRQVWIELMNLHAAVTRVCIVWELLFVWADLTLQLSV